MKLAQVLVVVIVGVCLVNGQIAPTDAPAETTAAPAETTAAPAETTAAPAETTAAPAETTAAPAVTTAAPRRCILPNARCNRRTDTCCSRGMRRTCQRGLFGVYTCRV